MIGASENPYAEKGSLLAGISFRGLNSEEHYSGTQRQYQRQTNHNYVVNTQRITELSVTYAFSERCSGSLGVPLVDSSWSVPLPVQPTPGPRSEQNADGIGDVVLAGSCWLLSTPSHTRGNVALGFGVKAPTGESDAADVYPILDGSSPTSKPVDMSIQPGDGGWGFTVSMQSFHRIGKAAFIAGGSYLANPRDTNRTPSIVSGLGLGGNPAFASVIENTVPDQYVGSLGFGFPLGAPGLTGSLSWRIEGVPRYDLIGDSHGFRRPGYETFLEPRISYMFGDDAVSLGVPIGLIRNRQNNPYTGLPGDATFPDVVVLLSYAHRFRI